MSLTGRISVQVIDVPTVRAKHLDASERFDVMASLALWRLSVDIDAKADAILTHVRRCSAQTRRRINEKGRNGGRTD